MLGVLILNYNNAALTIQCIESILKVNTCPCKILIVDNASTDDSVKILQDYICSQESMTLVVSQSNGGYARGNNLGLSEMEKDSDIEDVLILNNDILFVEDILPAMQSFLNTHHEVGLVGPLLKCRDGLNIDYNCARKDCTLFEIFLTYIFYFTDIFGILSFFSKKRKILRVNPELLKAPAVAVELLSGSCMMAKMSVLKEIGYFDSGTFLYYEENILYRKLLRIGKTNYILPSISCIHLGGQTTNKVQHSVAYMIESKASGYYYVKNYRDLNVIQSAFMASAVFFFNSMIGFVRCLKKAFRIF